MSTGLPRDPSGVINLYVPIFDRTPKFSLNSTMADVSGTFYAFQTLCKDIEDASLYTAKTEIIRKYLKTFKGDLYLLCKLLLCRQDKRVYNVRDKSLVKLIARCLNCSQDEMVSDLENGDASETAKKVLNVWMGIK
jgi:hypothetical protein